MPELTAKEWIENTTAGTMSKESPEQLKDCWASPDWSPVFRLYAVKVGFAGDSVDFLDAVDKFGKQPTVAVAQQIYATYVRPNSPSEINVSSPERVALMRWFEPDAFQKAFEETQHDDSRDAYAFRESVSALKASPPDGALAQTIYDEYVSDGASLEVDLSPQTRADLIALFESHPAPGEKDFFDGARESIFAMLQVDTYMRFRKAAADIRPQLAAPGGGEPAVSRPGGLKPQARQQQPAQAAVKTWNEKALKALGVGDEVDFFQVGDVVIVANPAAGVPPGVVWAQQEGAATGTITMTQKGGAFDPGSIRADGVADQEAFRRAIASVSKKRIEYA